VSLNGIKLRLRVNALQPSRKTPEKRCSVLWMFFVRPGPERFYNAVLAMNNLSYGEARRRFWERAYCTAMLSGSLTSDRRVGRANLALAEWEQRWVLTEDTEEKVKKLVIEFVEKHATVGSYQRLAQDTRDLINAVKRASNQRRWND